MMNYPNYHFRRRMAVQVTLWAVLIIVISVIMFSGCCQSESEPLEKLAIDKPEQSHKLVTGKLDGKHKDLYLYEWAYVDVDWTDPRERLGVVLLQLKQLDEDLENYRNSQPNWRLNQETLIQYHQTRVQLLFQISAEAQSLNWNIGE